MKLLYILIFLIPFQNHPLLSRAIVPTLTPIKMVGFGVLFYALYLKLKRFLHLEKSEHAYIQEWLFLIFSISQIVLAFFWYPDIGGDALKSIISFIIFYTAATTIIKDESGIRSVLWACLFAMAWSSIYMYKEYFQLRHVFNGFRPRGSFGDSNYFSIAALMVVPMGVSLWGTSRGKEKLLALFFTILVIGGVMVGQSRGGMIGLVIIAFHYFRTSHNKGRFLLIALFMLPVGVALMPANFWERVKNMKVEETTEVSGDAQSNKRRVELPRAGILMFQAKPVLGVGLGNYKVNSARYNPIINDIGGPGIAHNTYIEMLGEGGMVGFSLFLGILLVSIVTFGTIMKKRSYEDPLFQYARGMQFALFAYSFAAIFLTAQYSKFFWLLIFLGATMKRVAALAELKGDFNENSCN